MADDFSAFRLPSGEEPEWVRRLRVFARHSSPLLLLGETGVGKTMISEIIHRQSARSGTFASISLHGGAMDLVRDELFGHVGGAFTGATTTRRGLLEEVGRGTLLIDEIGDASPEMQALLLPVLDSTPVGLRKVGSDRAIVPSARYILATMTDLREHVRSGQFRSDLWFRISGMRVVVPPLRHRLHELDFHCASILRAQDQANPSTSGEPYHLSEASRRSLFDYEWPGNLRELKSAIEAGVALGEGSACVELRELGHDRCFLENEALDASCVERRRVEHLLRENRGNVSKAADVLGLSRTTVYELCRRLSLHPDAFRRKRTAQASVPPDVR